MANYHLYLLLLLGVSALAEKVPWKVETAEKLFRDKFLTDEEAATSMKVIRPASTKGSSTPRLVTVELGYKQITITKMDEANGYIYISAWETARWIDTRLGWNESAYPGITSLRIPPDYIWLPEITFTTSSTGRLPTQDENLEYGAKVVVNSTGYVTYIAQRDFSFYCDMNVEEFPYDTQFCSLILTSWIDPGREVNLQVTKAYHLKHRPHSEWKIVTSNISDHLLFSFYPAGVYENVVLSLEIKQRPQFFFYMFILPAITMAFVLPIIHLFPPGSSQKTNIAGLLLVSSLLLHVMLYQQIRGVAENSTPKLVGHYDSQLIMIVISIGISSFTASLANAMHTSRRVPEFLRKLMNSIVGRVCCFTPTDIRRKFTNNSTKVRFDADSDEAPIVNNATDIDTLSQAQPDNSSMQQLAEELRYVRERKDLETEWYQLAVLVDRLTAIVLAIYTLIAIFTTK